MTDFVHILFNLIIGLILGTFFYGGLYLTVQKGLRSKTPGFIFALSFFVRTAVVLSCLVFISRDGLNPLLMTVFGFFISRLLLKWIEQRFQPHQIP